MLSTLGCQGASPFAPRIGVRGRPRTFPPREGETLGLCVLLPLVGADSVAALEEVFGFVWCAYPHSEFGFVRCCEGERERGGVDLSGGVAR